MTGYYSKTITISELIKSVKPDLLESLMKSKLALDDINISFTGSVTNGGGVRLWFECPKCSRRCGKLYGVSNAYLCRECLKKLNLL